MRTISASSRGWCFGVETPFFLYQRSESFNACVDPGLDANILISLGVAQRRHLLRHQDLIWDRDEWDWSSERDSDWALPGIERLQSALAIENSSGCCFATCTPFLPARAG